MFTEVINHNGVVVEVERLNPRRAQTKRAQYLYSLSKAYPMVNDLTNTAGVIMLQELGEFIEAAIHIKTAAGVPFGKWPDPSNEKGVIAAYDWWTEEGQQEIAELIKTAYARLDNPNGTTAGTLTEDQAKDPLSPNSEKPSASS